MRAWVLLLLLLSGGSCAHHPAPAAPTGPRAWTLPRQAADGDLFCAEPQLGEEALPARCRRVGEVRRLLESAHAN